MQCHWYGGAIELFYWVVPSSLALLCQKIISNILIKDHTSTWLAPKLCWLQKYKNTKKHSLWPKLHPGTAENPQLSPLARELLSEEEMQFCAKKNSALTSGDNILKTNWFQNNWAPLQLKTINSSNWLKKKKFLKNVWFFSYFHNINKKIITNLKRLLLSVQETITLLLMGTKHSSRGGREIEWKSGQQNHKNHKNHT